MSALSASSNELTAEEIAFANAFNKNRPSLAGFASCLTLEELRVVRDGFYIGMAAEICKDEVSFSFAESMAV
jgi:hypothetical protein